MPTFVRAARRRVARPRRPRPRRRVARPRRPRPRRGAARAAPERAGRSPPAGPAAGLPDALLPELAIVLADLAWALSRKEDTDDAACGQP
jgi:hypothetical protein